MKRSECREKALRHAKAADKAFDLFHAQVSRGQMRQTDVAASMAVIEFAQRQAQIYATLATAPDVAS